VVERDAERRSTARRVRGGASAVGARQDFTCAPSHAEAALTTAQATAGSTLVYAVREGGEGLERCKAARGRLHGEDHPHIYRR
jgi:hypothetical protein